MGASLLKAGVSWPCAIALSAGLLAASATNAQETPKPASDGQAAKQTQKKETRHVYTEEDLKRSRILTPEDAERAQLAKPGSPAASPDDAAPLDAQSGQNQIPLGDVARKYRQEKTARESELALKKQPGFHLAFPAVSLAAPKPLGAPVAPRIWPPKAPQIILWGLPSAPAPPRATPNVKRVSPFAPRPRALALPRAPEISPRTVPPALATVAPRPERPRPSFAPKAPRALAPGTPRTVPGVDLHAVRPLEVTAPPPGPVVNRGNAITVHAGDSLWKLAKTHLGSGAKWQEFIAANRAIADPNRLVPGQQLVLPVASSIAGKSLQIKALEGDSLWKMARSHLGHGTAWSCVLRANPAIGSPERLPVGFLVTIPAACRP